MKLVVRACAAEGKMPPPGWTKPNEDAGKVNVSNMKRYGQSMHVVNPENLDRG
jgi:hypothetical protein